MVAEEVGHEQGDQCRGLGLWEWSRRGCTLLIILLQHRCSAGGGCTAPADKVRVEVGMAGWCDVRVASMGGTVHGWGWPPGWV